jgi:hypothetical protein
VTGTAATPPPPSGSPVPVTVGKVQVRLGKAAYRSGEVIQVTVANGLDKPVYTEDFKTMCTIVTLQRSQGGSWSDITGCALGRPTATVTLGPGLGQAVTIDPNSFHLRESPIGPGTYRVKFGYRLEQDPMGQEPLTAYSPEFSVR